MPPEKSGIADYTAAFVQALRPMATVRVFSGPAISALAHLDGKFDRVISAVGNAPLHDGIYDQARRWGSAVICHDARLLGLASGRGLDHAAAVASAELGRTVRSDEIEAWASDERQREASFLGELAQTARPLIFHSPQPVALVRERFGVAARFVPFAIQRQFAGALSAETKAQARRALGLPEATKLIASFGFVTRGKGIAAALRALALLRETMDCRLVFVGQAGADAAVFEELAVALGVRDAVVLGSDFISEPDYRRYLLAADCGLQLREGGSGNISGALQDCIAAGLPSVASRDLADNLAAPIYVRRVSDAAEPEEIAAALASVLAANSSTEWERDAYCAAHSMAGYARAVLAAVDCG
jgi:glycosyltransferase involved in cell wall biosynthesis